MNEEMELSRNKYYVLQYFVAYDESRDAPTISNSFSMHRKTLMSFLCMVVTSVAILLQFDLRVMTNFDLKKTLY